MELPIESRLVAAIPSQPLQAPQGMLFARAALPRQLPIYKSELEDEFLPPRDQRLKERLTHH